MGTLIIDRKDVELRHEGARILVYEQGERRSSIPAARLDRVIILSRARLDTGLLGMLAERGIGLAVLNPRKRDRSAMVMGLPHNDVNRRLRQYRMAQDTAFRQRFAAETVRAKIESQAASLNRARLLRPDRRRPLTLAIRSLSVLARRVTGAAPDVAVTMGLKAPRRPPTSRGLRRCSRHRSNSTAETGGLRATRSMPACRWVTPCCTHLP